MLYACVASFSGLPIIQVLICLQCSFLLHNANYQIQDGLGMKLNLHVLLLSVNHVLQCILQWC